MNEDKEKNKKEEEEEKPEKLKKVIREKFNVSDTAQILME